MSTARYAMPQRASSLRTAQVNSHHCSANSTTGCEGLSIASRTKARASSARRDFIGRGHRHVRRLVETRTGRRVRDRVLLARTCPRRCCRTAASTGSARRCPAACTRRATRLGARAQICERTGQRGAARDAGEDALTRRQQARQVERLLAADRHDLVDPCASVFCELGHEVRRPTLNRMRAKARMALLGHTVVGPWHADAARIRLRVVGLADHDPSLGRPIAQDARDALERAARAKARHPVVEPLGEVVQDLDRGRARVDVGVGFVLELARQKPTVRAARARPPCPACPCLFRQPASAPPSRPESA